MIRQVGILAAVALITGCTLPGAPETRLSDSRPEGARSGSCWAQQIVPAVIQTSRTQSLIEGGVYQTETSQTIVSDRQEVWFEVPCSRVQTPEFIASLQRALAARGFYRGPVTGVMDERTAKAVRLFQMPLGVDSQVLSLVAAQQLGLVAVAVG
jgi:hypothetical protein